MKYILTASFILLMTACIPDNIKEKINHEMGNAQVMMADWEFKKAISNIELHKLRNGHYPSSLSELKFVSPMDSSIFANVEYTRLDSVYELNLKMKFVSLDGKETGAIKLNYPTDFWQGLGCIRSNTK
jgi:hypothetical protein